MMTPVLDVDVAVSGEEIIESAVNGKSAAVALRRAWSMPAEGVELSTAALGTLSTIGKTIRVAINATARIFLSVMELKRTHIYMVNSKARRSPDMDYGNYAEGRYIPRREKCSSTFISASCCVRSKSNRTSKLSSYDAKSENTL